jgi:hypothetical protein
MCFYVSETSYADVIRNIIRDGLERHRCIEKREVLRKAGERLATTQDSLRRILNRVVKEMERRGELHISGGLLCRGLSIPLDLLELFQISAIPLELRTFATLVYFAKKGRLDDAKLKIFSEDAAGALEEYGGREIGVLYKPRDVSDALLALAVFAAAKKGGYMPSRVYLALPRQTVVDLLYTRLRVRKSVAGGQICFERRESPGGDIVEYDLEDLDRVVAQDITDYVQAGANLPPFRPPFGIPNYGAGAVYMAVVRRLELPVLETYSYSLVTNDGSRQLFTVRVIDRRWKAGVELPQRPGRGPEVEALCEALEKRLEESHVACFDYSSGRLLDRDVCREYLTGEWWWVAGEAQPAKAPKVARLFKEVFSELAQALDMKDPVEKLFMLRKYLRIAPQNL